MPCNLSVLQNLTPIYTFIVCNRTLNDNILKLSLSITITKLKAKSVQKNLDLSK